MQRRADKRKYHYIYKITRNDGKFYVGMHSTDNLDDGYFGSGQKLWHSLNKYGKDAHQKEILEFLPSRVSLAEREREIITEELLNDPLCMNLTLGGHGGWETRNKRESSRAVSRKNAARLLASGTVRTDGFKNKKHSDDAKRRISEANAKYTGEHNSQFGTCWVIKTDRPVKIKKEELDVYLAQGYIRGRKLP